MVRAQIPIHLQVDKQSPIPIRRQLTEQLKHVIEAGGVPRDQPLPSIRELAGFLGVNPNTIARVIEDLKRSGYVEARRGKGCSSPRFRPPAIRPAGARAFWGCGDPGRGPRDERRRRGGGCLEPRRSPARGRSTEPSPFCSSSAARQSSTSLPGTLEAHLRSASTRCFSRSWPAAVRRQKPAGRWGAAVTSSAISRWWSGAWRGMGIPVIALLAEAHLETLHRLAQLPSGTRVGVASAAVETAHNLEHSIANAGLPNIALVGTCSAEGAALGRLVRRVDVIVCSSAAAERVRGFAGPTVQVIIDDRALDQRAIEMLASVLVQQNGERTTTAPRGSRSAHAAFPREGSEVTMSSGTGDTITRMEAVGEDRRSLCFRVGTGASAWIPPREVEDGR